MRFVEMALILALNVSCGLAKMKSVNLDQADKSGEENINPSSGYQESEVRQEPESPSKAGDKESTGDKAVEEISKASDAIETVIAVASSPQPVEIASSETKTTGEDTENIPQEIKKEESVEEEEEKEKDFEAPEEDKDIEAPGEEKLQSQEVTPETEAGFAYQVEVSCDGLFSLQLSGSASVSRVETGEFPGCQKLKAALNNKALPVQIPEGGQGIAGVKATCANGFFTISISQSDSTQSASVGIPELLICENLRDAVNYVL